MRKSCDDEELKNVKGRALFRKSVNYFGKNIVNGQLQIL